MTNMRDRFAIHVITPCKRKYTNCFFNGCVCVCVVLIFGPFMYKFVHACKFTQNSYTYWCGGGALIKKIHKHKRPPSRRLFRLLTIFLTFHCACVGGGAGVSVLVRGWLCFVVLLLLLLYPTICFTFSLCYFSFACSLSFILSYSHSLSLSRG